MPTRKRDVEIGVMAESGEDESGPPVVRGLGERGKVQVLMRGFSDSEMEERVGPREEEEERWLPLLEEVRVELVRL